MVREREREGARNPQGSNFGQAISSLEESVELLQASIDEDDIMSSRIGILEGRTTPFPMPIFSLCANPQTLKHTLSFSKFRVL